MVGSRLCSCLLAVLMASSGLLLPVAASSRAGSGPLAGLVKPDAAPPFQPAGHTSAKRPVPIDQSSWAPGLTGRARFRAIMALQWAAFWPASDGRAVDWGRLMYSARAPAAAGAWLPAMDLRRALLDPSEQQGPAVGAGMPDVPASSPLAALPQPFTGVVIDCRGLHLAPSPSPRILTADGHEVWGALKVTASFAEAVGIAGFMDDWSRAIAYEPRVGSHPLIVRAIACAGGQARNKALISDADATRLKLEDSRAGFLEKCHVMFVIDPIE